MKAYKSSKLIFKVFAVATATYLPALFWDLPAMRFNIVEAKETSINGAMAETYLKAGLAFAEGLEQELRTTNLKAAPQSQVVNQLNSFGFGMQTNFRQAYLHIGNYSAEQMRALRVAKVRPVDTKVQVVKVLALSDMISASVFDGRKLQKQETLLKQVEEIQSVAAGALAQIQMLRK